MAKNDAIRDLFDSLPSQSTPPFRPTAGTTNLFTAEDEMQAKNWRVDGYRWHQNGSIKLICSDGDQLTKSYFWVSKIHFRFRSQ